MPDFKNKTKPQTTHKQKTNTKMWQEEEKSSANVGDLWEATVSISLWGILESIC